MSSLNRVLLIYVSKSFAILNLFIEYDAFKLKDINICDFSFVWQSDGSILRLTDKF